MTRFWALEVPAERYRAERLYHHETLELTGLAPGPRPGDEALLVAQTDPPLAFAVARVVTASNRALTLGYTQRNLDCPQPVARGMAELDEAAFRGLVARLAKPADRREWLVSVDLPIEAASAAEAVREFWTYVMRLGPGELPAFVAPADDELAMQAYVCGDPTNLDPEDDED